MSMGRKKNLPAGMRYTEKGIQYRFTIEGKRYAVYGKTSEECSEKRKAKEKELSEGQYKKGQELTLSEYFDRWIAAKAPTVKETTIRTNKILFSIAQKIPIDKRGTAFGDLKVKEIEVQNIRDVQSGLLAEGKTTRTVNDTISLLKSILQAAMNVDRIIDWNPAAGMKNLRRTEPTARTTYHRALSKEETELFLQTAKDRNSWYYNLYCFLLDTGCRCGEAGALLNKDIASNVVHIYKTITRAEDGTYRIGEETKTAAGKRDIPLRDGAKAAVNSQRHINALLKGNVLSTEDPIFTSVRGQLLNDTAVNQDIKRICKQAGIERFSAHAFRDTFATRCVESGMDPKTLQEILGHTDISMTMNLYAHVMPETKETQMQAVKTHIV